MKYLCPVCAYDQMLSPPHDFYICPCCGTEFDNDDFEMSHDELMFQWLDRGCPWFSKYTLQPLNWDPIRQLAKRGTVKSASGEETLGTVSSFNVQGDAFYWNIRPSSCHA